MKHFSEAFRSANLFDTGSGYLVMSRFRGDGSVEAGFFLLDVFCLGVKDAGFHRFNSIADYHENLIDWLFPDGNPVRMTPAVARKLAEDAISYARGLGFSPGTDYKKASRVFGGVTTAECDEQFTFGKNDKPFYIQGPWDSKARVGRILRVLKARCGEGGYHYIVTADNFESLDGEEENVGRRGLEHMAAELRASQPGMKVRINPPGRRKISNMIRKVTEPLLKSEPDYESKEMILKLTTLAWNFTLLDPIQQGKMRVKIANLFKCPEGMEMCRLKR